MAGPGSEGSHADALEEIRELAAASSFYAWSGMRVIRVEHGEVDVVLDVGPHQLNLQGLLHGGMIATLADTASGLAIRSMLEPGRSHATIQLDVHFLSPGREGRVEARGRAIRVGGSVGYAEADVVDADERLLARVTATHAIGRAQPSDQ